MFRIFLKKKLLSGEKSDETTPPTRSSYRRNRRIFERYNVTQQHLTILNDQDILVIREISPKGFSSDVSPRAFERFTKGDVFEGRIKYMGELYDFHIKVAWKRKKVVGFEIVNTSPEGLRFLNRLIRPIDISQGLKETKTDFLNDDPDDDGTKVWFHSDEADLMIWYDDSGDVEAWRLTYDNDYIEWILGNYETGKTTLPSGVDSIGSLDNLVFKMDPERDSLQIQFAIDVIMTLESEHRQKLVETIMES